MIFNRKAKSKVSRKHAGVQQRAAFLETLENRRLLAAWSLQDQIIGLDKATQNYPNITGAGETVVLIDQGVDYNHPALGGGYGNKVITSWNFDTGSFDVFPYDNNAHGTGSAGEVAGSQRIVNGEIQQGVAPGVKLIALKASGSYNVRQAFDWVVAHRSQYNIVGVNWVDPTGGSDSNAFLSELQTLSAQGVFVGGPTGNYGPGPAYRTPGHAYFQAGSSNLYGGISGFTPTGPGVDLVAPGENVNVTWYYNGIHAELPSSGTSWAGPQIVGAASLIKQVNPNFTPNQILQILRDSGTLIYDSSGTAQPQLNVNAAIGLAYQRSGQSAAPTPAPVAATPAPSAAASSSGSTPFKGTPFSTGASILAAYYDAGGQNVGYHTISNYNESGNTSFRPGDYVGVKWTNADGGSAFVGWTHAGESLNYTINAAATGAYTIQARVADPGSGASFHVEIDGKAVTSSIAIQGTGSWNSYTTVSASGIYATAGLHVLKIVMDSNDQWGFAGNFLNFNLTPGGSAGTPAVATGGTYQPATGTVPNGPFALSVYAGSYDRNTLAFYDNSNNESGFVVERADYIGGNYTIIATIQSDANTSAGTGWRYYADSNGIQNGSTYYYRVHAINQVGSSSYTYASVTAN